MQPMPAIPSVHVMSKSPPQLLVRSAERQQRPKSVHTVQRAFQPSKDARLPQRMCLGAHPESQPPHASDLVDYEGDHLGTEGASKDEAAAQVAPHVNAFLEVARKDASGETELRPTSASAVAMSRTTKELLEITQRVAGVLEKQAEDEAATRDVESSELAIMQETIAATLGEYKRACLNRRNVLTNVDAGLIALASMLKKDDEEMENEEFEEEGIEVRRLLKASAGADEIIKELQENQKTLRDLHDSEVAMLNERVTKMAGPLKTASAQLEEAREEARRTEAARARFAADKYAISEEIMPVTCPLHARYVSVTCPLRVRYMPVTCPLHVRYVSVTCPLHAHVRYRYAMSEEIMAVERTAASLASDSREKDVMQAMRRKLQVNNLQKMKAEASRDRQRVQELESGERHLKEAMALAATQAEAALRERDAMIETLERELVSAREAAGEAAAMKGQLTQLEELRSELNQTKAKVSEAQSAALRMQNVYEQRLAKADEAHAASKAKDDDELARMTRSVESGREQLEESEDARAELEVRIAELEAAAKIEAVERRQEVGELQRQIEALTKQLKGAEGKGVAEAGEVAALKSRIAELEDTIKLSTSAVPSVVSYMQVPCASHPSPPPFGARVRIRRHGVRPSLPSLRPDPAARPWPAYAARPSQPRVCDGQPPTTAGHGRGEASACRRRRYRPVLRHNARAAATRSTRATA